MSGPVQIFPPGLLGFLQLKNSGANPSDLTATLQTVIEARDWLFQARMLDALNLFGGNASVNAALGVNFFAPYVVPQNAWLYVDFYTVVASLLAADYIRIAPVVYTFPGIAGQSQLQVGPDVNDLITARPRTIQATGRGFFVPPASQFGFRVYDFTTAGSISVTGMIRAALLPS